MNNNKYNLSISTNQARTLCRALDLYSRIGMGQFTEILFTYERGGMLEPRYREEAVKLLDRLHYLITRLPPSAYHGIHSNAIHDDLRVAFDLQQVIRHKIAWTEEPGGGATVDFREPMRTSTTEELAKIKE